MWQLLCVLSKHKGGTSDTMFCLYLFELVKELFATDYRISILHTFIQMKRKM